MGEDLDPVAQLLGNAKTKGIGVQKRQTPCDEGELKSYPLLLPVDMHRGIKVLAAKRQTTVRAILTEAVERILEEDSERSKSASGNGAEGTQG